MKHTISFRIFSSIYLILISSIHASNPKYLFTPEEITNGIGGIIKVFNGQPCGQYSILEKENPNPVGAIETQNENIKIFFRGARGNTENLSCVGASDTNIHHNFQTLYNNVQDSLIEHLFNYSEKQNVSLQKMNYQIFGHSRGSTLVPQTVETLLNFDINSNHIRAVGFSPLGVYSKEKSEEYNNKFGNKYHINFKSNEDNIAYLLKKAQIVVNFISSGSQGIKYYEGGQTFSYNATDYPEFNTWVINNPYKDLDPTFAWGISSVLSPTNWGAHMPQSYQITAPNYLRSQQNS